MTTISLKEFLIQDSLWGGKGKANKKDKTKQLTSFINAKAVFDDGYVRINIVPLSVNDCFKGRRFREPIYDKYEKTLRGILPPQEISKTAHYRVDYEFGFSNIASDIDNPVKSLTDVLQKFYGFNDKHIFEAHLKKVIVPKGEEYLKFKFTEIK